MKPAPYIGITGLGSLEEAKKITNYLEKSKPFLLLNHLSLTPYIIMLGVTCSNKRLADPLSSGSTSPSLKDATKIFRSMPLNCLRMVHYFTENENKLTEEIVQLFQQPLPINLTLLGDAPLSNLSAHYLSSSSGLQINQSWPNPEILRTIVASIPDLQITLQLPKQILDQPIIDIVKKASNYADICQYLLIDPSGGQGQDLDLNYCSELLLALDEALPKTTIGVAGGFGAENVAERIKEIHAKVKRPFCIDAQGKLRTNNKLDVDKVKLYLANAFEAWAKVITSS